MQARTVKGKVLVKWTAHEQRTVESAKSILLMAGRFTNAQVFDAAADAVGAALAAIDKLGVGEDLPILAG
jgi:hypothetical protein